MKSTIEVYSFNLIGADSKEHENEEKTNESLFRLIDEIFYESQASCLSPKEKANENSMLPKS